MATTFDRFFEISARGSTVSREIRGGLAMFFTMAYIVVLNPLILGGGTDSTGARLAIPAFLTIVIMPFTYSISNGIGAGVNAYTLLKIVKGTWREVPTLRGWSRACSSPIFCAVRSKR